MSLDVTYYSGTDGVTSGIVGAMISRVIVTLTGSSASLGTPPRGAAFAVLTAGEDAVVSNNGTAASDTNGQKLLTGAVRELPIINGAALLGKTA